MSFQFTKYSTSAKDRALERLFEIIPGLASWTALVGIVALSFFNPMLASIFVILFLLYWIFRIVYMTFFLALAYAHLSIERKTSWADKIEALEKSIKNEKVEMNSKQTAFERISWSFWQRRFERLQKKNYPPMAAKDIVHCVLIPVVSESKLVIQGTLESLKKNRFSCKQLVVVIAIEERAKPETHQAVKALKDDFQGVFRTLLVVAHPADMKGEERVKGANVTYAAKEAAKWLDEHHIGYDQVIASCFDADTIVHEEYFSCLTYYFLVTPDRLRASFQPIPVYHNNIWQVPAFARVLEMGASFFQLIEGTNPEMLVTFSSHSMSFKALHEVGYWPVDMISDDSAIFWKSYLHYDSDYHVIPIPTTVSMDVPDAGSSWETAVSLYKQKRRWAWGVENFPIVMRGFIQNSKISFWNKLRLGFKLFEGHFSWATLPFMLTVIGWLPALFAHRAIAETVLYYNTNHIAGTIYSLSSVALVATILLSQFLLPKAKSKEKWWRRILHIFEWLLLPFIFIFFSALPALDAQTRLMLGRRLEFNVSKKRNK